jgi:hypothetical protein
MQLHLQYIDMAATHGRRPRCWACPDTRTASDLRRHFPILIGNVLPMLVACSMVMDIIMYIDSQKSSVRETTDS